MRILFADDDPTSRLIGATALTGMGHECVTAKDGAEAWEIYLRDRPDVVISDWMMPGLSGLELCRDIRGRAPDGYTYFIMVTAKGSREQIAEGMSAGADDYLVKPLDFDALGARLIAAARVTALHRQIAENQTELEALNQELIAVSLRDRLTGLGNRMALDEDLARLEARVTRYGHRYCLGLLDVDHFKAYNDTYGHQAGDRVLQAVAAQLKAQARGGDGVYRHGGEEFLIIFPEQSLETATIAVERMRTAVEALAIPHAGAPRGTLTLSGGLALLDPADPRTAAEVLREADEALYRAKALGRNRTELSVPGEQALLVPAH